MYVGVLPKTANGRESMNGGNLDGLGYKGATIVLTGGASGMGEAATQILSDMGAQVHVLDIAEPKVPHASFTHLDLSDLDAVRRVAADVREKVGTIDYLFPIAGIPPHALGALTCMTVNYIGTRLLVEELLPAMKDGGGIGLVSSTAGRFWERNLENNLHMAAIADAEAFQAYCAANPDKLRDGYSTSKELLFVWVQQLAPKIGQERGIRVNCIAPCPTSSPFMDQSAPVLGKEFLDSYPYPLLGRMATPAEQAWSLILLTSPLNGTVTGTMLYTDQGYTGGLVTGAVQSADYRHGGRGAAKPS